MITTSIAADRSETATEYLCVLRSLAAEVERAMVSIASNRLVDLEESLANQQLLTAKMKELSEKLSTFANQDANLRELTVYVPLSEQIAAASSTLKMLNRRYAALLMHSRRSVTLMLSLFCSFQGQLQEGTGARSKQQTWSCQV